MRYINSQQINKIILLTSRSDDDAYLIGRQRASEIHGVEERTTERWASGRMKGTAAWAVWRITLKKIQTNEHAEEMK